MKKRRVALLYGKIDPAAALDEKDTLVQAETVGASLRRLGWDVAEVPVTLDLARAVKELSKASPRFVFNLVESLDGKGRLVTVIPSLLDSLGIPFTGAPTDAVFLTSNKLLTKTMLAREGIPTPPWMPASELLAGEAPSFDPPYIAKEIWEHASIGLDDAAVAPTFSALMSRIKRRVEAGGIVEEVYVEPYIEGREFNVALLGGTGNHLNPQCLPPAEIRFEGFPPGKPKIVGYKAKWDESSFECKNTPRSFDIPPEDTLLVEEMTGLSLLCWLLFGLRGYARVDFRTDSSGNPFVLEINANPCIAPDAGFPAAAAQAGLSFDAMVERIVMETIGDDA
jgi:D-alanine-D-alanine ligase